jgi:two-component system response regulator ResD
MAPIQPAKPRVLLVDDDDRLVHIVSLYLESQGFDVLTAATGEAAVVLLEGRLPDLVILDIVLPGLDGLNVCRRLRALRGGRHPPILVITALTDSDDVETAMAAGADRVITKPFNLTGLGAAVVALLPETATTRG